MAEATLVKSNSNMSDTVIDEIRQRTGGDDPVASARSVLAYVVERFGDTVALSSSLGAEDQVLTDLLAGITARPRIFTLDTGRLPQETYDLLDATRARYDVPIKVLFPDRAAVESMVQAHGANLFYRGMDERKLCCRVRKLEPLRAN